MARALQTVIVRKTHPRARTRAGAAAIARKFSDRVYTSRETSTSWRFRRRPPSCFVRGSFRTACPTEHVCLTRGTLKKGRSRC